MLDVDAFIERAAIMEIEGGLSRFAAETAAAQAQGMTRWQALEGVRNADGVGNPSAGRDQRPQSQRDAAHHMPGVQRDAAQQDRSMPERVVPSGRRGLEMLALPVSRGRIL